MVSKKIFFLLLDELSNGLQATPAAFNAFKSHLLHNQIDGWVELVAHWK